MVKFIVISGCVCVSVYRAGSKRGRLISWMWVTSSHGKELRHNEREKGQTQRGTSNKALPLLPGPPGCEMLGYVTPSPS